MVIIGLDPHPGSHTAAALDENGATLGSLRVANDEAGLDELWGWAQRFSGRRWAIEGAGNRFLAPLVARLLAEDEELVDIAPSLTSQYRAKRGKKKDDRIDAANAARALLANPELPGFGRSEAQGRLLEQTRTRSRLSRQLVANRMALAALRTGGGAERALARVVAVLEAEKKALDREIEAAVRKLCPELLALPGVGPQVASVLLAEAGEKAFAGPAHFASYCGAAPVSRSSGKRQRAQVNPGGNRRLNWALYIVALNRLRFDPRSQELFERKQREGKTGRAAFRILKTYIARELYRFMVSAPSWPLRSAA